MALLDGSSPTGRTSGHAHAMDDALASVRVFLDDSSAPHREAVRQKVGLLLRSLDDDPSDVQRSTDHADLSVAFNAFAWAEPGSAELLVHALDLHDALHRAKARESAA